VYLDIWVSEWGLSTDSRMVSSSHPSVNGVISLDEPIFQT
jgi:hypothetical protein